MANCGLCGQPMPTGEEMFQYHGFSGPCPTVGAEECDHEWNMVDDSFDHEYGTERIVFERCEKCDKEREHEPRTFDDDVI